MDKKDILSIAEGLRLIEQGVERIQNVMREKKIHSLQDIAAELLPLFKKDDDSLSETIVDHLGKN